MKKRIAVLVSGGGTNLQALIDAEKRGDISRLQLVEFVDPSVAEPLIAVQDKLSNLR